MKKTKVLDLLKENHNGCGIEHWKTREPMRSKLRSYGIGLIQLRQITATSHISNQIDDN